MGWLSTLRSAVTRRIGPGPLQHVGGTGGWRAIVVREPHTGAWQENAEITVDSALAHPAVYACTSLIASDIGKVRIGLAEEIEPGVWADVTNPAYSPVLRKPNRYQTIHTFLETWIVSKLTHGNTYVLKERDQRRVVIALYVLDPTRVCPLVTPSGAIYYELRRDDLAGLADGDGDATVTVPASEIIHDLCVPLFHPLVGVPPIFACGGAAVQGLSIQANSTKFFQRGSNPGGILLAPGKISDDTAKRLKDYWQTEFSGDNVGNVAVLGDNLQYKALSVNPVDAQLIEQLKWSTEQICQCYHVPVPLIDASVQPPYGNTPEPLLQLYYSQCLQAHMTGIEAALEDGLAIAAPLGVAFDINDLIWFDITTRTKAASEAIRSGAMSPNESRRQFYGLGKVTGGETPYLQQQMFSLAALAERDANDPFVKPPPAAPALPAAPSSEDDDTDGGFQKFVTLMHTKAIEAGLYAA